ncbi:unnamed protein product [Diatraea saccharalis]|uniref:Uncharacterized protein n=1 Tax=Diatraea saccharalis TaxID=40085 RepID=A0A9N9WCI1_9NEOP|nr:unnamed protein product [Diatraea saccharalis]
MQSEHWRYSEKQEICILKLFTEGSSSVLAVVWTATLVLSFYGAFMLYRGFIRCLRSRRLKTITKV